MLPTFLSAIKIIYILKNNMRSGRWLGPTRIRHINTFIIYLWKLVGDVWLPHSSKPQVNCVALGECHEQIYTHSHTHCITHALNYRNNNKQKMATS